MEKTVLKKILLLYTSGEKDAPSKIDREILKTSEDTTHYPLGLAYLYSVLEKEGYEINLLSLVNNAEEDCYKKIKETLKSFSPDVVCFQMLTFNRTSTFCMMEYVHAKYPEIKQIIGGIHATIMYRQIIEKYPYAIAVLGEGELTIVELVKKLSELNYNLHSIDGISFSENGTVITTKPRELISNLDEIPFPKHEIFFEGERICGEILTTRGCPSKCSFCCLNSISRGRVRMRSVSNIIEEIEMMIKKFPKMNRIYIHDDTFFVDNQRVINFCDEIIKRNIKINFACNARVKPMSEEMVKKLERANFGQVHLGIESGDNGILQKCHKGITQEEIIHAFKIFAKTKIAVYSFLIIGLPGENTKTIMETINFLKKLQKIKYVPNCEQVGILKIFPGTEVYDIAKAAGFVNDDYWLTDKPIPIFAVENSIEELEQYEKLFFYHLSQVAAFCTWTGFKSQFSIIPYHLKYIFNNKSSTRSFLIRVIKFILPARAYASLKRNWKLFFYKLQVYNIDLFHNAKNTYKKIYKFIKNPDNYKNSYFAKYHLLKFIDKLKSANVPNAKKDMFNWKRYNLHYRGELKEIAKTLTLTLQPNDYSFIDSKLIQTNKDIKPLHENWRILYETILQLEPESVLEMGCGNGMHLNNIQTLSPKIKLSGIDLDEKQLNFLKETYPKLNANTLLADATTLFPNNYIPLFDLAFTQAVIMHIHEDDKHKIALANLFNTAKKYVILVERWKNHTYIKDIKDLLSKKIIKWDKINFYYKNYPSTNVPCLIICSPEQLSYPALSSDEKLPKT